MRKAPAKELTDRELLQECLWALNALPRRKLPSPAFRDTYELAEALTQRLRVGNTE